MGDVETTSSDDAKTAGDAEVEAARDDDSDTATATATPVETIKGEEDKTPALRAFVLRPPPRRVMQKRSYESVSAANLRDVRDVRDVHDVREVQDVIVNGEEVAGEIEIVVPQTQQPEVAVRPASIASHTFGSK